MWHNDDWDWMELLIIMGFSLVSVSLLFAVIS